MSKDKWIESKACKSEAHCAKCRDKEGERHWREGLRAMFELPGNKVDFACPLHKKWEKPIRGLGDLIEKGTELLGIKPCKGCKKRRDKLNKAVPLGDK